MGMVLYELCTNGVKTAAMNGLYKVEDEDELVSFTRYELLGIHSEMPR
jgi:hypothetical protein